MSEQPFDFSPLDRREFLRLLSGGALLLTSGGLFTGCGGGGGGDSSSNPPSVILQPNVQVIPADGTVTITTPAANTLVLTGSVPTLAPGAVIVSGQGNGLIRKVVSTAPVTGGVQVTTTQATMEDVFQQAQINFQKTLGPSDFAVMQSTLAGVTIGGGLSGALQAHQSGTTISLSFDAVKLQADGSPLSATVSGSGSLSFSVDHSLEYDALGLKSVRFLPRQTANFTCTITGKISKSLKAHYGHFVGTPFPADIAGIPVILVPTYDTYFVLEPSVSGSLELGTGIAVSVGVGVQYQRGSGWQAIKAPLDPKATLEPNANLEIGLGLTPLHFEYSELIYGIVGPSLNVDCPTFEVTATAQASPPGVDIKAAANFNASLSFKVEVFGKTLADEDLPGALKVSIPFYDKTFAFDGTVGVGVQ